MNSENKVLKIFRNSTSFNRTSLNITGLSLIVLLLIFIMSSLQGLSSKVFADDILGDIEYYKVKVEGSISNIRVSKDGSLIVVGSDGGDFGVVALTTSKGELLWSWRLRGGVTDIEATDSLSKIGVTTRARELYLYNVMGYVEFRWERGGKGEFLDLALDSKAELASIIDSSSPPHLYILSVVKPVGRWEEILNTTPTSISYLLEPNGLNSKRLAVSYGGNVSIVDLEDYTPSQKSRPEVYAVLNVTSTSEVSKVVLFTTPDSKLAIATSYSNNFTVLSVEGGEALLTSNFGRDYITGGGVVDVEVSRGGEYVYFGSLDYNVYCLSWEGGEYVLKWSISVGREVSDISTSESGDLVVAGTIDGWVYLLGSDGDILWSYKFSKTPITAVGISGDGSIIAVGCSDGSLYIVRNDGLKRYILELSLEEPVREVNVTLVDLESGELVFSNVTSGVEKPMLLLKPGSYSLTVDSLEYGVYSTTLTLKANTILSIPPPRLWSVPIYSLTVNVVDGETGDPVGGVVLEFTHTLLDSSKYAFKSFNVTVPPTGSITLPLMRDVYTVKTVFNEEELGYENVIVGQVKVLTPQVEPLTIKLKPLKGDLRVVVYDDFGQPLSGVKVEVSKVGVGITGSSGEVEFQGLRYGVYTVLATHPYYVLEAPVTCEVRGDTLVKLRLKPKTFKLQLNVLDVETLEFISRANVSIVGKRFVQPLNYTYTPEFNVLELPYGEYSLQVSAEGFEGKYSTILLDGDKSLEIKLQPVKYTFNLTVLGRYDLPVKNAKVLLESLKFGRFNRTTDENGFTSLILRPSTYKLKVEAPHYTVYVETLEFQEPTSLTLKLKPENYTLTFRVYDASSNASLPDFKVSVFEGGVEVYSKTLTSKNNTLALPYGNYTLKVSAKHYIEKSEDIVLNRDLELEFPLAKTLYPVTIMVSDDTGAPMVGVKVVVENPPLGLKLELTTDSTGRTISTLPFGAYQISVEAPGWNPARQVVMVEGPVTLEIILYPNFTTLILRYLPYTLLAAIIVVLALIIRAKRKKGIIEEEIEEI